ncbi:MAG: flavin reductase family protein [Armatimonadota bacterium]
MAKQEIAFTDYFDVLCERLGSGGCLLTSLDEEGAPNVMTIGWALLGVVWRRPICAVLVRPSRYTYGCIEATGDFTVNVPPEGLAEEVLFCGTESGRDYNKFEECGFTATESTRVKSPGIGECLITHECAVVQKNDVEPELFVDDIISTFYAGGDFHRVYYGEVLASRADIERLEQL